MGAGCCTVEEPTAETFEERSFDYRLRNNDHIKHVSIQPADWMPLAHQVIILVRNSIHKYFGIEHYNHCGFFVDSQMSRLIHQYMNSMDYPRGDGLLRRAHTGWIMATVISNDGLNLYTASADQTIARWNLITRKKMFGWKGHRKEIQCLDFYNGSNNNRKQFNHDWRSSLLASGSSDHQIRVWNAYSYQLIHTLVGHTNTVNCVRFDHMSNAEEEEGEIRLVSGSADGSIRLWSAKTGSCLTVFNGFGDITCVLYWKHVIVSGSGDSWIKIWSQSTGKCIKAIRKNIVGSVFDISINSDGSLLACSTENRILFYQWLEVETTSMIDEESNCLRFHPWHPEILAVGCTFDSQIKLYNVSNGSCLRILKRHFRKVQDMYFTPDGSNLVSVSNDQTISFWDMSFLNLYH